MSVQDELILIDGDKFASAKTDICLFGELVFSVKKDRLVVKERLIPILLGARRHRNDALTNQIDRTCLSSLCEYLNDMILFVDISYYSPSLCSYPN